MVDRSLTPDHEELENLRGELVTYSIGAVPGVIVGAVAGVYGADEFIDYVDFLSEAPRVVRGGLYFLGGLAGGLVGDAVGGFSALGICSFFRGRQQEE